MKEQNQDKIYILRKAFVMLTCMAIFITVGLVVINFQSKEVTVNYYGKTINITTMSNTVEGMLMQNGIYIDEKAVIYPSKDDILTDKMEIFIYSEEETAMLDLSSYFEEASIVVFEEYFAEDQVIEFAAVEHSNANKDRGLVETVQEGVAGSKHVVYTTKYTDETDVETNIINETIYKEAVDQIIEVGTSLTTVSRGSMNRVTADDIKVDSNFKSYNIALSSDLQKYTYNLCKKYGVNYETFLALMYVESRYNQNISSVTGDYGLCQINKTNYYYLNRTLGVTDLLNPYDNIKSGVYLLSIHYNTWRRSSSGDELDLHALNSYNFGEGGYRSYLASGKNAWSWHYGRAILNARNALIQNGGL